MLINLSENVSRAFRSRLNRTDVFYIDPEQLRAVNVLELKESDSIEIRDYY